MVVAGTAVVEVEVSTEAVAADFMEAVGVDFTEAEEDSPAGTLDLMAAARLVAEDFTAVTVVVDTMVAAVVMDGAVEATAGVDEAGAEDMVTVGTAGVGAGDLAGAGRIGDMAGDIRMATMATQGITRPIMVIRTLLPGILMDIRKTP